MTVLECIERVLADANGPLHYVEITDRMIGTGLWKTEGRTPAATVSAHLSVDIVKKGEKSRFIRTDKGVYALRTAAYEMTPHTGGSQAKQGSVDGSEQSKPPKSKIKSAIGESKLTLADAAELVLGKYSGREPMHYKQIAETALQQGLIVTEGQNPERIVFASMLTDNKRKKKRGEAPRFDQQGKGFFGLTKWAGVGLVAQIQKQNDEVRKKLHERLFEMDPTEFEVLVGRLLVALGFEAVTVTSKSGDGGIDVRGTLVVGDVVRTKMAVQVKRWKKSNNIQAPTIQQVRGSLSSHEQGLIITTSDFSKGASEEAMDPYKSPVGLMNGDQLVKLLIENDIGVTRATYDLIELGTFEEE
jgi:restriction system protein